MTDNQNTAGHEDCAPPLDIESHRCHQRSTLLPVGFVTTGDVWNWAPDRRLTRGLWMECTLALFCVGATLALLIGVLCLHPKFGWIATIGLCSAFLMLQVGRSILDKRLERANTSLIDLWRPCYLTGDRGGIALRIGIRQSWYLAWGELDSWTWGDGCELVLIPHAGPRIGANLWGYPEEDLWRLEEFLLRRLGRPLKPRKYRIKPEPPNKERRLHGMSPVLPAGWTTTPDDDQG